jgi:long-chain acyl-CoA synthetase
MLLHRPLIAPFVKLRIEGVENLNGVEQPVIFIANHVSYLDQPAVAQALPCGWRRRTATAAWAEFFFSEFRTMVGRIWKRLTYEYGSVFLHLFPLPQSAGFRGALRHMGYLVDHGYNILVFPEGARSADGRLLPFQKGLGIMVAELGLPVVPVAIIGMEHVLPRGAGFPRRGEVTVRFGAPLWFAGAERDEIVTRARQAVDELMQG